MKWGKPAPEIRPVSRELAWSPAEPRDAATPRAILT